MSVISLINYVIRFISQGLHTFIIGSPNLFAQNKKSMQICIAFKSSVNINASPSM